MRFGIKPLNPSIKKLFKLEFNFVVLMGLVIYYNVPVTGAGHFENAWTIFNQHPPIHAIVDF